MKLGDKVKMGQRYGLLGKEGASGGWSHLHFDIKSKQPSGQWVTEEGYAFLWESYVKQYKPNIVAVARPHHLIWVGEKVRLDGSRSWSETGRIARHDPCLLRADDEDSARRSWDVQSANVLHATARRNVGLRRRLVDSESPFGREHEAARC